jgi:Cof subfamily protein (haloacid dehalogenase superfamily)
MFYNWRVGMKYKLIAMDMDGTLLNDRKEVSERSQKALKKASELGVKLVVCTGRIFVSARYYARMVGTKAPVIASNGAYIREKDRNEIVYEKALDNEVVHDLVDLIKNYDLCPQLFTIDTIYTEKLVYFSKNYSKWNESLAEEDRIKIEVVEDIKSIIDENSGKILKSVVMGDDADMIKTLKREIKEKLEVTAISSMDNNIEIMAPNISKGNAVKVLADYYGILPEEVICVGDNENDLSMIEYAGLGVAMGNATQELKLAADYITDTNEKDGVAKVIERFIIEC